MLPPLDAQPPPDDEEPGWDRLWRSLESGRRDEAGGVRARALAEAAERDPGAPALPERVTARGPSFARAHRLREATRCVIRRLYRLGDPGLVRLDDADLMPAVAAARAGGGAGLPALVRELAPRLFTLELVSASWRGRMLDELDRFRSWARQQGLAATPPNSMHDAGVLLADLGLSPLLASLREDLVRPLAARLYPDLGGASLDVEHGYAVSYGDGGGHDLGFHVDDAEVTLNLCLGADFEGGDLYLRGLRCAAHVDTPGTPDESCAYRHRPGVALLHAGMQRHGALPVRAGTRTNLILWCRSSSWRQAASPGVCPAWCGVHRPG